MPKTVHARPSGNHALTAEPKISPALSTLIVLLCAVTTIVGMFHFQPNWVVDLGPMSVVLSLELAPIAITFVLALITRTYLKALFPWVFGVLIGFSIVGIVETVLVTFTLLI